MALTRVGIEMWRDYHNRMDLPAFRQSFVDHLKYSLGKDHTSAHAVDLYQAIAYTVRDRLIDRMMASAATYTANEAKRVYYLSLEFLLGRSLENNLVNLGYRRHASKALDELGLDLTDIGRYEEDAGLGNGGLGRLAACFLDSMATLGYPGYGYGLRYEFGIFRQEVVDGWQVERPDSWLRNGNPWEIIRPKHTKEVRFYGRVVDAQDADGNWSPQWVDYESVLGVPYDTLIVGHGNNTVNLLRLWSARASTEFDFQIFNCGDYSEAVALKTESETISKVLYPNDDIEEGKELRLKQEYFFVSCSIQDILRRFVRDFGREWHRLPDQVAIQLNDTHPALAIPELMHLLIDREGLGWDEAWDISHRVFAYTNHTLLPEALERWPVGLLENLLPRHLQIIYEINRRFLEEVRAAWPGDDQRARAMSIIEEGSERQVRMANLAVVGSHHVNGVAQLHTDLIRRQLMPEFAAHFPERFVNKTNGITPRRWLLTANPRLASLISERIGSDWTANLDALREIDPLATDRDFSKRFREAKQANKRDFAGLVEQICGEPVDPASIFDVQVKRIHEYKRQLMNLLHVVWRWQQMRAGRLRNAPPRTVMIGGKAAPGYAMAKLHIKLINAVAARINAEPATNDRLKLVFLPNYSVSLAERVIPAADVSEQISTAGFEASGTGNMKFALNGAITVGTLDGANIEIAEEVGEDNIVIFGLTADEVIERRPHYEPLHVLAGDPEISAVVESIRSGEFSPGVPDLFAPVVDALLHHGDRYMVLADMRAYIDAQHRIDELYADADRWVAMAVRNTARVGKFSSDRTIREYAEEIWGVRPQEVRMPGEGGGGTQILLNQRPARPETVPAR